MSMPSGSELLLLGGIIALISVPIVIMKNMATNHTMKIKSQFASFVFTATFGPLGLFYSSSLAAFNMIVLWIISAFVIISKTSMYSFYSLPDLVQYAGAYVIWAFLIYIASIITGIFTVMNYNDNFAVKLEALIDKKISMRDMSTTSQSATDVVNATTQNSEAVNSNGVTIEKVFCTKCGKENNSDAKFCTSCGAGIVTGE